MNDEVRFHFGLIPGFYFDEPAVLFWGSSGGLLQFAALLRDFALEKITKKQLEEISWMESVRKTRILVELVVVSTGMTKIEGGSDREFYWGLTRDNAKWFAELVEAVARSENPGHNYLDSVATEKFTIIVSMGEYDGLEKEVED